MDWYLPSDHEVVSQLRSEVRDYLERHSVPGSDIGGAELAFSELLTNAVEHSGDDIWVSIDWGALQPVVTIQDLGPGFELDDVGEAPVDAIRGRGLMIATHLTEQLSVANREAGGSRVTAVLPIDRADSADHDMSISHVGMLPDSGEARDGYFAKEPFLKALAVEMAHMVDLEHGPDAAERAVTHVGMSVGGRMEEAFRAHDPVEGSLSPEKIAELYVGLKSAIGGDFYVVSVDGDKIVLGNRHCPFGEAVKHAPSLCRMTSSVFGGIAARNRDGDVAVHLEERIAVGDPECRVTVWLDQPPEELAAFLHRYPAMKAAGDDSST